MVTLMTLNPKRYKLTPEQQLNLCQLCDKINVLQTHYSKPFKITSGFRSRDDQAAIYAKLGKPPKWGSAHLKGAACDIEDLDGSLWKFCTDNMKLIEKLNLYLEEKSATPTWVHFQLIKPKSGVRIFKP